MVFVHDLLVIEMLWWSRSERHLFRGDENVFFVSWRERGHGCGGR
jgi:hypothetical protein